MTTLEILNVLFFPFRDVTPLSMKNIFAGFTILVLIFLLSACGKEPIKDGVDSMKSILKVTKADVQGNDASGVKEQAEALENSWSTFEDVVKGKSPDLYKKVEDPLLIIQAGAKSEPLDVNTLQNAITELDRTLDEMANLK